MIKLTVPSYDLKDEIIEFKDEFMDHNENSIPGSELLDKINNFEEWMEYISKNSSQDTVSEDWVVTDIYLAINNESVVGIISLRHELNDFLKDFGHVGYSVRPSCRCNGFAKLMLKKVLVKAKELNMQKLQLSAQKNNIASRKIIEENNGVYMRSFDYLDNEVYVYEITL